MEYKKTDTTNSSGSNFNNASLNFPENSVSYDLCHTWRKVYSRSDINVLSITCLSSFSFTVISENEALSVPTSETESSLVNYELLVPVPNHFKMEKLSITYILLNFFEEIDSCLWISL